MDEKLAVVARYDNAETAHLDRIVLEEAGIQAVLGNENTVSTNWFLTIPAGGVQLFVCSNDLEQARQVLQEVRSGTAVKAEAEQSVPEEENDLACPACGSSDVNFETYSRKGFFLAILLFRFPFAIKVNRAVCRQCGHKWKQQ